MNAAVAAFHMADYVWTTYGASGLAKVLNQTSKGGFYRELVKICPDFALIQDVANAHKHMKLTHVPPDRQLVITSAGAVELNWRDFEEGPVPITRVEPDKPGKKRYLVAEGQDGTKTDLSLALTNVIGMWQTLIQRYGL